MDIGRLGKALGELYDAGFYAKYPNEVKRIQHRADAIRKASDSIIALIPPKIPVYKSQELAEKLDGPLDIDLKGP